MMLLLCLILSLAHFHLATREKHLVVHCLTCGTLKRFLAREGHRLWSQQLGEEEEEGEWEREREEEAAGQHQDTCGSAGGKGQLDLLLREV